ncbi:L-2,4-diaminobutyrate decarboxylase [Hyphodiscus hymeniophilus]|uniref:L-2,4-diaminobutyrate decarboxylase n=1 Tax=Hyphodiscus hymeniophilus TaxID=353542 RepID=A0A9P6VPV9_9HELO|nr:L-2,4-diaminobutyrate decarboxylase [Hyphodiscus hymeniophilus]
MAFSIASSYNKIRSLVESASDDVLPAPSSIAKVTASLPSSLPVTGLGDAATEAHLLNDITPGFNGSKIASNYYGFVTGGVLPIAEVADNIVTAFDQNVQVHLPDQSVSTVVEDKALSMLVELLKLGDGWEGKTFTTGATGANILGLACGREAVINHRRAGKPGVGERGMLAACMEAGVKEIQILTTMGHSSLYKAASVIGLGRNSLKDIPFSKHEPWRMDIDSLEQELKLTDEGVVSIVALSAGEVNTGRYATNEKAAMKQIRALCDKYGAWLHVDGAFGIFARSLPDTPEFSSLISTTAGLELADSITGDGHKMLNVPYDCGFFLTRSASLLSSVVGNPNAAYLSSGPSSVPSPLNMGLENSRRFRALPVYAVLLACGREGLGEIFARQVRLARAVSEYIYSHEGYELLAQAPLSNKDSSNIRTWYEDTHIIVLFSAKDDRVNGELVKRINSTRKIYVSGTQWDGKSACRIAVSTWKVDVERDLELIRSVLDGVLQR